MPEHLRGVSSEVANALVAAIQELLGCAPEIFAKYGDELQGLSSAIKSARIGYPFLLEERCAQEVDRLGGVLLGPVFTSDSYPWPVDEDSNPMAPLCQLNTREFPRQIEGVNGLIQVWLSQKRSASDESLIRVIPAAEVVASSMAPVITHEQSIDVLLPDAAEWLREAHQEPKPSRKKYITAAAITFGYTTADELSDANWDEWTRLAEEYDNKFGDDVVACWQISGFEEGRIYCDISIDQKSTVAKLETRKADLEKNKNPVDELVVQSLVKVCKLFSQWIDFCGENTYPCLFGTFDAIQYSAAERDEPIICFESIGLHEWGDGGNAQVFYRNETGFYFNWSCM